MEYSIVTSYEIIRIFKSKSKYYEVSLGFASTAEGQGGNRVFSQSDDFAYFYNQRYNTAILKQGQIGNINFYTDHQITIDQFAFYYDREEYIFDFDRKYALERGVDLYLGHIIKKIETELKNDTGQESIKQNSVEQKGDADKLSISPGSVRYDDIKAYLDKRNAERMKI